MFVIKLPGAHVPHRKNTAGAVPVRFVPESVLVPTAMHIGAPAVPVVAAGDHVDVGTKIADAGGFVSAAIHSGVSGTVAAVEDMLLSNGRTAKAIRITADGQQTVDQNLAPRTVTTPEELVKAAADCGLVGLGGAGFPTAVKFSIGDKPLHAIVVNGAECEPYITSDTRTMLDRKEDLFAGARLLLSVLHPERFIIGVEANKPACIAALKEGTPDGVEVKALPSLYPQGGEKVLIYHTTGRTVPAGKLPIDAGCIVINCTTLADLWKFVSTGMPLTEKCVTVDGGAVNEPKNVIVPIGTSIHDLLAFCGGVKANPGKILYGGPMMGTAVPDDAQPVLKNTNAVLALTAEEAKTPEPTPCIRCGKCLSHCPFRLEPRSINEAYEKKDMEALQKLRADLCMECGCCSFVCPAHRPLTQVNKLAKGSLGAYLKAKKEAAK